MYRTKFPTLKTYGRCRSGELRNEKAREPKIEVVGWTMDCHWDPPWKGPRGLEVCRRRNTTLKDLLVIIEGV